LPRQKPLVFWLKFIQLSHLFNFILPSVLPIFRKTVPFPMEFLKICYGFDLFHGFMVDLAVTMCYNSITISLEVIPWLKKMQF